MSEIEFDQVCRRDGNNRGMNKTTNYLIPAGTTIKTRNQFNQLKMKVHVTRRELCFENIANTGDGGMLWYFQHGDWLIAVPANRVLQATELIQTQGAA